MKKAIAASHSSTTESHAAPSRSLPRAAQQMREQSTAVKRTSPPRDEPPGTGYSEHDNLPKRRRIRTARACETCRRKKVKCNGKHPCEHCQVFEEDCHFREKRTNKPIDERNDLENRLARMETLLRVVTSGSSSAVIVPETDSLNPKSMLVKDDALSKAAADPPGEQNDLGAVSSPDGEGSGEGEAEAEGGTETDNEIEGKEESRAQLKLDKDGNLRYFGNGSTTAALVEVEAIIGRNPRMVWLSESTGVPLSLPPIQTWFRNVPPRCVADELVDVYFSNLHPVFPVLHRPTFMKSYLNAYSDEREEPTTIATTFTVFAMASLARKGPANETEAYFRSAVNSLHDVSAKPSLSQVQAWALISLYHAASNNAGKAWLYAGTAMRLAIDQGIHRSLGHRKLTKLEREVRRRVFWSIYILDRLLATCLGRPVTIHDDDINVELPTDAEDIATPYDSPLVSASGRSSFIALIYLYRIAGQISRSMSWMEPSFSDRSVIKDPEDVRNIMATHTAELREWFDELPSRRPNRKPYSYPHDLASTTAQISYYSTVLMLHRSSLARFGHGGSGTSGLEDGNLRVCVETARSLIQIQQQVKTWVVPSHFLFAYTQNLLVCGGLLLLELWRAEGDNMRTENAEEDLILCDAALASMEDTGFLGAGPCRKTLQKLTTKVRDRVAEREDARHRQGEQSVGRLVGDVPSAFEGVGLASSGLDWDFPFEDYPMFFRGTGLEGFELEESGVTADSDGLDSGVPYDIAGLFPGL